MLAEERRQKESEGEQDDLRTGKLRLRNIINRGVKGKSDLAI